MPRPDIIPANRVTRYDVVNTMGEDLGQIETVMIDISQGRVAFAVVAFGGILGLTDKWFALPWEILNWSPEQRKFVIDMPREILETAPGLDKHKWPDEIDLSWLAACYAHYGCAPYWHEPIDEDAVKRLAYSIWREEGMPDGRDLEHYYLAERMLKDRKAAAVPSPDMPSMPTSKAGGKPPAKKRR